MRLERGVSFGRRNLLNASVQALYELLEGQNILRDSLKTRGNPL